MILKRHLAQRRGDEKEDEDFFTPIRRALHFLAALRLGARIILRIKVLLIGHCLLLAALALLLAGGSVAQDAAPASPTTLAPVTVTTRVEPQRVTIGTPFRYSMRVEASGDVELIVPVLGGRIGDFTITDFGEVPRRQESDRAVIERWYTMVTYEAGDKIVPGPTVQYRLPGADLQRVDAPDALVIVDSLLAKAGDANDVRDVKGPVAVPRDYRPLWWALVGCALLAGLGVAFYRVLNRARPQPAAPPRPADEVAQEALARLRSARLLETGAYEAYYVRLSGIVRTYLESRFHLRAPEMTTEEFLQAAQHAPQLVPAHRSLLSQFLTEADLVKFARYQPALEDAERAYTAAWEFIESTAIKPGGARAAA